MIHQYAQEKNAPATPQMPNRITAKPKKLVMQVLQMVALIQPNTNARSVRQIITFRQEYARLALGTDIPEPAQRLITAKLSKIRLAAARLNISAQNVILIMKPTAPEQHAMLVLGADIPEPARRLITAKPLAVMGLVAARLNISARHVMPIMKPTVQEQNAMLALGTDIPEPARRLLTAKPFRLRLAAARLNISAQSVIPDIQLTAPEQNVQLVVLKTAVHTERLTVALAPVRAIPDGPAQRVTLVHSVMQGLVARSAILAVTVADRICIVHCLIATGIQMHVVRHIVQHRSCNLRPLAMIVAIRHFVAVGR